MRPPLTKALCERNRDEGRYLAGQRSTAEPGVVAEFAGQQVGHPRTAADQHDLVAHVLRFQKLAERREVLDIAAFLRYGLRGEQRVDAALLRKGDEFLDGDLAAEIEALELAMTTRSRLCTPSC